MGVLLGVLGSAVSRVVGVSHLLGSPIGAVQTAVEGLGLRFVAGALAALYFTSPAVRAAINALAAAVKAAIVL